MRVSDRIKALCAVAVPGERLADIGTDHAYVPLLLYRDGIAPSVILSDISAGSLAKARATFLAAGIELPASAYRIADGIAGLDKGEVDAVVIAGLGGYTIRSILAADIEKARSFRRLILQPRNNSGLLRAFLYAKGWAISGENLAREGKFICEIITAVPLAPSAPTGRLLPYPEEDIRWRYPESMLHCDQSLLRERLAYSVRSHEEEVANLRRSRSDQSERIARLQREMAYLRDFARRAAVDTRQDAADGGKEGWKR